MKIIISAYECSPYRGSEAGLGWNWVMSAYCNPKIDLAYVLTINRYEKEILKYLQAHDDIGTRIRFVFLPLPLANVKKLNQRFKYIIWQKEVGSKAKELASLDKIDFCHHVTWATCVLPTYLHKSGVPFVYGPIGGGERIPSVIDIKLSLRDRIVENVRNTLANISVFLPPNRAAYSKSAIIFSTTEDTKKLIPTKYHEKTKIMQSIGVSNASVAGTARIHNRKQFIVFLAARMIYWKGIEIAVEVFRKMKDADVILKIAGDGRKLKEYKKMTSEDSNIEFLGNLTFDKMREAYWNADCVLNCSLHDSGCMVVLEAMSQGCPVIAVDTGGPASLLTDECGIRIKPASIEKMSNDIAEAIYYLKSNPSIRKQMGDNAILRVRKEFCLENKYDKIINTMQYWE